MPSVFFLPLVCLVNTCEYRLPERKVDEWKWYPLHQPNLANTTQRLEWEPFTPAPAETLTFNMQSSTAKEQAGLGQHHLRSITDWQCLDLHAAVAIAMLEWSSRAQAGATALIWDHFDPAAVTKSPRKCLYYWSCIQDHARCVVDEVQFIGMFD